jgi:hypothetical protein
MAVGELGNWARSQVGTIDGRITSIEGLAQVGTNASQWTVDFFWHSPACVQQYLSLCTIPSILIQRYQ